MPFVTLKHSASFKDEFQLFKCQKVALSGLEVEKYKMLTASQE